MGVPEVTAPLSLARLGVLLLALTLLAPPAWGAAEMTWEFLEEEGAVIGGVEVVVNDVFDTSDPREDHLVGRSANFIHIRSRRLTIYRELLFKAGDRVDARLMAETERRLRSRSYIGEARVEPLPNEDGTVTARVTVVDTWSLKGGLKFRYEGGDAEWAVDLEEVNLLGLGKTLRLGYERNRERNIATVGYKDPALFGSRWRFAAGYADLSDGSRKSVSLGRPFTSLDTDRAFGLRAFSEESTVRLYELGEEIVRYPADFERGGLEAWKTVLRRERWALRLGGEYDIERARYGAPLVDPGRAVEPPTADDRDLQGLLLHLHYLEDRYGKRKNMASIGKTEDVNFGWDVHVAAGMYLEALGSASDAYAGRLALRKHWQAGEQVTLKLAAAARGRYEKGRWEDSRYSLRMGAYDQRWSRQTVTLRASFDGVVRAAPESILTIGASDGLRGYVNDFLSGDRRWVVSLEERIVTGWVIWGMAQVGFVAFGDAGAVRRLDDARWSRTYADAGGGLRIGNLKSSYGRVVVATIAFPLVKGPGVSNYEIFIGNEIPF